MAFLNLQSTSLVSSYGAPSLVAARMAITPALSASASSLLSTASSASPILLLRGGEISELVQSAYEWNINLGAPAALVAGAVVATIYENISSGELDIEAMDGRWTRLGKKFCRVLLLSAFALEVMSIFVTTVTGTMLMSRSMDVMAKIVPINEFTTPLSFLRDNFEFEYLTARITFLQGLLNWLAAIGLSHWIPTKSETASTRVMNKFLGVSLAAVITLMMAFYNSHISFYDNYAHMLLRWFKVTCTRLFWHWPPRMMAVIFVTTFLRAMHLGYLAFGDLRTEEEKETQLRNKKK